MYLRKIGTFFVLSICVALTGGCPAPRSGGEDGGDDDDDAVDEAYGPENDWFHANSGDVPSDSGSPTRSWRTLRTMPTSFR